MTQDTTQTTPVGVLAGLASAGVARIGKAVAQTSDTTQTILVGVLTGLASAGAYWLAIVVCEYKAARAKSDGVEDWEDAFWPTMLRRLDRSRYEKCKLDVVERKGE